MRRFTLVELMVGIVLVSVIAIATGAYLINSQIGLAVQRRRRVAVEAANQRMEAIRAAPYEQIEPGEAFQNYNTYFLSRQGTGWRVSSSDPGETVEIAGEDLPMTTTVKYHDVDGGFPSYDCLDVTVRVRYLSGTTDAVRLQTYR